MLSECIHSLSVFVNVCWTVLKVVCFVTWVKCGKVACILVIYYTACLAIIKLSRWNNLTFSEGDKKWRGGITACDNGTLHDIKMAHIPTLHLISTQYTAPQL